MKQKDMTRTTNSNLKQMSFIGGVTVVVGSIVGSGIFVAPALAAAATNSLIIIISLWLLGALLCLIGADIYGRLGEYFPDGGGQYVYLKKSLGNHFSFLYGWTSLLIICPAMIAGIAIFFGEQFRIIIPSLGPLSIKLISIGLVSFFTLINLYGIDVASLVQKVIVILQLALIALLIVASLILFKGTYAFHDYNASIFDFKKAFLAFTAILWSFEGFNTATFITNEIKDGYKKVRKIIFIGCLIVLAIYCSIISCAMMIIPYSELIQSSNVAVSLSNTIFSATGKWIVLILTVSGIITTIHTSIIIGPRITKAMADDTYIFQFLKKLDPVYTSPNNALKIQFLLVTFYIITGSFESLISYFIVFNWLFYCLVAIGFMKIHMSMNKERTILFWESVVFILLILFLLFSSIYSSPLQASIGVFLFICGIYASRKMVKNH